MNNICDTKHCTGCGACLNICPKDAISMCEGTLGHIYPRIDSEKCIDCGLCNKVCPVNNPLVLSSSTSAYAAWAKDEEEHKTSTSGGAAAVFTNYILENGGVVYGSIFDEKVLHKRISNKKDAIKLKGSKYAQSHTERTFVEAKRDLDAGITVLYIGTPCQIAGLKGFLNGKTYDNLITVDLICHGVPSQKLLFEYIKSLGFNDDKIQELSFRDKDGSNLMVVSESNRYYKNANGDLYFMAFYDNLTLRDSCYSCQYAFEKRISDITIGDFWGLGRKIPFTEKAGNGISVILPNTTIGEQLIENCKEHIYLVKRTVDEAVSGNHNLKMPSLRSKKYIYFQKLYATIPIKKALKRAMRMRRLKALILRFVIFIKG